MNKGTHVEKTRWEEMYELAKQYAQTHGNLAVPGDYQVEGKRLGAWIGTQRGDYKLKTNPCFTKERVERLQAIGMIWDVREWEFQTMVQALEEYRQTFGSVRVPQSYVTPEGRKLGIWVNRIRLSRRQGTLSPEREKVFNEMGMVWEPQQQRQDKWAVYFKLVKEYVAAHRSLPPASYVTEEGIKLGMWLSNQKQNIWKGTVSRERKEKLDQLNIPADHNQQCWDTQFELAKAHFLQYGSLGWSRGTQGRISGPLANWLSRQRKAYQVGKLEKERIQRLEEIGMVWDVREELWERMYQQAKEFYQTYGHLQLPTGEGAYAPLRQWLKTQRQVYHRGSNRCFTPERVKRLEAIGMVWDVEIDPAQRWENWYQKARAYYQANGHLQPGQGELRTWLLAQRAARKGKRGSLTQDQIARLDQIGMAWDVCEENWRRMYQCAKEYVRVHERLNAPVDYVTEDGIRLGSWLARQRKCYRKWQKGEPGGITPQRMEQLNALNMVWDGERAQSTSFPEKALLFYLKKQFPDAGKLGQWQSLGVELDVYLPSIQTAIEYDGWRWHQEKEKQDREKGEVCRRAGIRLIRVREPRLPRLGGEDLMIQLEDWGDKSLEKGIRQLADVLGLTDLDVDLKRDRPKILETYRNDTARAWERMYQKVKRAVERGGREKEAQVDETGRMAVWINLQREAYRNNSLTALQIKKLEGLGIQWSPFEERWRQMYEAAQAYRQGKGDLLVPSQYVTGEGLRLGAWIYHQRELYRTKKLSRDRVTKLERIGMVWDPLGVEWEKHFHQVEAFVRKHGHMRIPRDSGGREVRCLSEWLSGQRDRYRAGTLEPERIEKLERLGMEWTVFQSQWDRMFERAKAYFLKHGTLWFTPNYVEEDGYRLGQWVARQRRKEHSLTQQQRSQLDSIGMVWDPYEEKWMSRYRAARAFYERYGHLRISTDYVTEEGTKLGMWVSSQRQAYRGNPNFHMTARRKRLLDEIGMDWTLKRQKPGARSRPNWTGVEEQSEEKG